MSEPLRKAWSEDELRMATMEFMRVEFGSPNRNDSGDRVDRVAQSEWYERQGLLIQFVAWMWDLHLPADTGAEHG